MLGDPRNQQPTSEDHCGCGCCYFEGSSFLLLSSITVSSDVERVFKISHHEWCFVFRGLIPSIPSASKDYENRN
jgi:hypothetical protein